MSELSEYFKNLNISADLFRGVKFYVSGELNTEIIEILKKGGADHSKYFSDFVTHLICGENPEENDIIDAKDVYEISALSSKWVVMCAKLNRIVTTTPYVYNKDNIFKGKLFCFSKIKEDLHNLWAIITYNGGIVQLNLNYMCNYLVTTETSSPKYEKAISLGPDVIKIVTPDWVIESVKNNQLVQEDLFHPRLINWPKIDSGNKHESTTTITGFEEETPGKLIEPESEDVSNSTQALLDKLKQRMPWNQPQSQKEDIVPPNVVAPSFINKIQEGNNDSNKINLQFLQRSGQDQIKNPSAQDPQQLVQNAMQQAQSMQNQRILNQQHQQQMQNLNFQQQQQIIQQIPQSPQSVPQSPQNVMTSIPQSPRAVVHHPPQSPTPQLLNQQQMQQNQQIPQNQMPINQQNQTMFPQNPNINRIVSLNRPNLQQLRGQIGSQQLQQQLLQQQQQRLNQQNLQRPQLNLQQQQQQLIQLQMQGQNRQLMQNQQIIINQNQQQNQLNPQSNQQIIGQQQVVGQNQLLNQTQALLQNRNQLGINKLTQNHQINQILQNRQLNQAQLNQRLQQQNQLNQDQLMQGQVNQQQMQQLQLSQGRIITQNQHILQNQQIKINPQMVQTSMAQTQQLTQSQIEQNQLQNELSAELDQMTQNLQNEQLQMNQQININQLQINQQKNSQNQQMQQQQNQVGPNQQMQTQLGQNQQAQLGQNQQLQQTQLGQNQQLQQAQLGQNQQIQQTQLGQNQQHQQAQLGQNQQIQQNQQLQQTQLGQNQQLQQAQLGQNQQILQNQHLIQNRQQLINQNQQINQTQLNDQLTQQVNMNQRLMQNQQINQLNQNQKVEQQQQMGLNQLLNQQLAQKQQNQQQIGPNQQLISQNSNIVQNQINQQQINQLQQNQMAQQHPINQQQMQQQPNQQLFNNMMQTQQNQPNQQLLQGNQRQTIQGTPQIIQQQNNLVLQQQQFGQNQQFQQPQQQQDVANQNFPQVNQMIINQQQQQFNQQPGQQPAPQQQPQQIVRPPHQMGQVWQQQQIRQTLGPQQRPQWAPGQQGQAGPPMQRQFIQLDAQTHNQLQKMPPEQQAAFVQKLQAKQRQFLLKQAQQRGGGHILIRGSVPSGLTPQQQLSWLQQHAQKQGVILQNNLQAQAPAVNPANPGPSLPNAPGLSPIQPNPALDPAQQVKLKQLRLQQFPIQREQLQKVPPSPIPQNPPVVRPAMVQTPVPDQAAPPVQDQQVGQSQLIVNPKTKTALANMLNIRLQSGGTSVAPGPETIAEPSAAGTLRLMTAQHNASLNSNSRPLDIIAMQQRRVISGPNGEIIRPPVPPTPLSEPPQLQFSPRPTVPVQHRPGSFYGHNPNLDLPSDLFLLGCIFVVVEIDTYLNDISPNWQEKIEKYGGEVEKQYCARVTHVLCETQRHGVVMQALRDCKRCVTMYWLNDILKRKQVLPPWTALHIPMIYLDTTPASKHLISLSGFTGTERNRVKHMIQYTGAKCTTYFSKHNTLLIAAKAEGSKYTHAKKWGIPVVNIQWLTDVMLGNFVALNQLENIVYQQFSNPPNFIFDPKIVPNLMHGWKMPINISQETYERIKRNSSPVQLPKAKKIKTEHITDENGNVNDESMEVVSENYRILFSLNGKLEDMRKIVKDLGGSMAKDHNDCTHLIMSTLKRSNKLMLCVCKNVRIVPEQWLLDCQSAGKFIDEHNYFFDTAPFNAEYRCDISRTLSSGNRDKLFENRAFWVTPSVFPSQSIVKELIRCCGGQVERIRRSAAQIEAANVNLPFSYIIITDEKDIHLVADLLKNKKEKLRIVCSPEMVFSAILKQNIEIEPYSVRVL